MTKEITLQNEKTERAPEHLLRKIGHYAKEAAYMIIPAGFFGTAAVAAQDAEIADVSCYYDNGSVINTPSITQYGSYAGYILLNYSDTSCTQNITQCSWHTVVVGAIRAT